MKNITTENLIKNIILIILLVLVYNPIRQSITQSVLATDIALAGDVLVAVSIFVVTACFGCFAFTYEKTKHDQISARLIAHTTTGLLMLLIGAALEMTSVLTEIIMGEFIIFNIGLAVLYIACVFYDFWDLKRLGL